MKEFKDRKEQVKELTDQLEHGVRAVFASEQYQDYLQTMAKFTKYSINNSLLIFMQCPQATHVAGYRKWQELGRQVQKGEKAIKILAPVPFKTTKSVEKLEPASQQQVKDKTGKPVYEEVEVTVAAFKPVSVFDISQTAGKELPGLGDFADELTGEVRDFDAFVAVLRQQTPYPIAFEAIEGGAYGYCDLKAQRIVIKAGLSQAHSLKTAIHEVAHSLVHCGDASKTKDRGTQEVEAESIAYVVTQYLGLDTGKYSFGYVASWSSDKELKQLKASLSTIQANAQRLTAALESVLEKYQAQPQDKEAQGHIAAVAARAAARDDEDFELEQ